MTRSFFAYSVAAGVMMSSCLMYFTPPCDAKKSKGASTAEPADENFNQGVSRFKDHDYDGAVDSFLQSTYFSRNGYNPEAYYWLGKAYMAKHNDLKAVEAFKKHIAQNMKRSPQAHCYLSEIYLRNDRDEEAMEEAKTALNDAMGPLPVGHLMIAKVLVKRGQYMDAETQFLDALGDHPWKYTEAWMCYAESRIKAKNYTGAYELLEKMVDAKGRLENLDLPKVYLDMGVCRLCRGDHQGAIDNFHQALELDPSNCTAHLELGMLFEQEQHYSSAIKEWTLYCSTAQPDDPKIKMAQDRIMKLEQKLAAQSPAPTVAPSPYMREQQNRQIQKIQQQQAPKDPGF